MNIGEAARQCELPAKTIRYYEDIDLVRPGRLENGYRDYSDRDIHTLRFLQRSRSLGFSIEECRLLLSLYEDEGRASSDVKSIVNSKIKDIDQKIQELNSLKATLEFLANSCHGNDKPDCPIIDDLSGRHDQ